MFILLPKSSLKLYLQSKDAQHAADVKRLAQHYQAQLAAAEGEIQKAQHAQVEEKEISYQALRFLDILFNQADSQSCNSQKQCRPMLLSKRLIMTQ